MSAASSSAFVAPRRRLFGALAASLGFPVPEGALPMRRPGKAGIAEPGEAALTAAATPPAPVRYLTKACLGWNTADLAALNALPGGSDDARWANWVAQQINPPGIADSACDTRITAAAFTTQGKTLTQLWTDHHSQTSNYYLRMLPMAESECVTLTRQVYSQRLLYESMVDFWHDHFSVFGWDYDGGPLFTQFDRDVIRPNAFGNFRALLEQVCRSTTMMYYLDLYSSTRAGPNENFARELFELHTLGAENYAGVLAPDDPSMPIGMGADGKTVRLKYVDVDVYNATRALTGWTLKNGHWQFPAENDGTFTYRDDWHEQYDKYYLNRYIAAYGHQSDGGKVFDTLASHPGTAHYLMTKLCRRFVADEPSAALVQTAVNTYLTNWQAPNQFQLIMTAILNSADFKSVWGQKMKRPAVATVHALRSLGANFTPKPDNTASWTTSEEFLSRMQQTGQRLFYWPAPNGYPDKQVAWASSGALGMTWRLLGRLVEFRTDNSNGSSPFIADIQGATLAAFPVVANRTAANIVGYWCDRLLGFRPEPTFGTVTTFLQQNALATDAIDLTLDEWHTNDFKRHYTQSRLRAAVSLILMSPDFLRR